jgi:hypothetical protein
MFELYGVGGLHLDEPIDALVATFSTEEKALAYVKKSRLKNPTRGKEFRFKSLLGGFYDAYVQEREEPLPVPHDPEL